jgi:hypothetical protein
VLDVLLLPIERVATLFSRLRLPAPLDEATELLLTEIRDALRRTDPAWCALHGQEQISDEELEELIGRVEDAVEDGDGTPT